MCIVTMGAVGGGRAHTVCLPGGTLENCGFTGLCPKLLVPFWFCWASCALRIYELDCGESTQWIIQPVADLGHLTWSEDRGWVEGKDGLWM